MVHFTITNEQEQALDVLCPLGFAITNFYGDGVIRMALRDSDVRIFVSTNGSIKKQTIPYFDAAGREWRPVKSS